MKIYKKSTEACPLISSCFVFYTLIWRLLTDTHVPSYNFLVILDLEIDFVRNIRNRYVFDILAGLPAIISWHRGLSLSSMNKKRFPYNVINTDQSINTSSRVMWHSHVHVHWQVTKFAFRYVDVWMDHRVWNQHLEWKLSTTFLIIKVRRKVIEAKTRWHIVHLRITQHFHMSAYSIHLYQLLDGSRATLKWRHRNRKIIVQNFSVHL